jgi:glutamine amidotransferase
MVVIVDYKLGNYGSIANMLRKLGVPAKISSSIADIETADKLILPGVGAFDNGMGGIRKLEMIDALSEKVLNRKTPILGICLGMQLMMTRSEEGTLPGLGWIKGDTVRFDFNSKNNGLKVPHMGWNSVKVQSDECLFRDLDDARFYFVHSYHVRCEEQTDIVAQTNHGYDFISSFRHENIRGVQFHPEKSHRYGLNLLRNFVEST